MQTESNRRPTVTRIGLIAVIILLLAYFVEWDQVITILRQTNWLVLLAGVIFLSIGFIFISVRWRFVLVDKPNLKATFHADSIGYMVTILSPIPGPAVRVFALSHSTKVSISSAAPAIVVDLLLTTVMRLVALILALNIVLAPAEKKEHGAVPDEKSLMSMAIYPMGLPLLLNPVGIVSLNIFSAETQDLVQLIIIAVMVLLVAAIDFGVFLVSHRLDKYLTHERIMVLEKLLGILLAALAVQMVLNGLAELGVITMTGAH